MFGRGLWQKGIKINVQFRFNIILYSQQIVISFSRTALKAVRVKTPSCCRLSQFPAEMTRPL